MKVIILLIEYELFYNSIGNTFENQKRDVLVRGLRIKKNVASSWTKQNKSTNWMSSNWRKTSRFHYVVDNVEEKYKKETPVSYRYCEYTDDFRFEY